MQELGLYDIHCHIVPGVDDGAVNLEEAVKMVEAQYKQGIRTIIATPHFRKGMFEPSASEVKKQFQILRKTVWEINKDMRLYLGSELYASENMISQIKDKRAMPMAGSNYVLTELYEAITASQVRAYLGILISKGYRPVIAHAERYGCMRNDINFIEDMIEMGAYIQLNADSVIGKEGFALKRFCKKLLKRRPSRIGEAYVYICRKFGQEYADEIFIYNPRRILEDARQKRAGTKKIV